MNKKIKYGVIVGSVVFVACLFLQRIWPNLTVWQFIACVLVGSIAEGIADAWT